jgi:large subunit ribosomal protein L21
MYAIVEIAGQQFKVEEGKKIFVHRLEVEEGDSLEFDQVLLIDNDGEITIGEPVIKDALIDGKILDHVRGDKVIVFKKKRKKGYRVKNGHRQNFTEVEITGISGAGIVRKAATKKETASAAEETGEPVKEKKTAKPKADKEAKPVTGKKAEKKPAEKVKKAKA